MARGDYKYEKQPRPSTYIPIYLSEKDEYIPNSHVGMYSLLRNEKRESIYMSEEACQIARKKTYDGVFAIYQKYNSPSFADLWNYNIAAINDCGLNYLITNPRLAPIGNLIECFEYQIKANFYTDKKMISFAINKSLLEEYFKNYAKAQREKSKVVIPRLKAPYPKSREKVLFGEDTVIVGNGTVEIDRNTIYNRFLHWCKLQGVEKDEGLVMAFESLFKLYPINGLNDMEYYNVVTELDRSIFYQSPDMDTQKVGITISGKLLKNIKDILRRYNTDPANIGKPKITPDDYVNNAIYFMNKNMPLKYTHPRLAKERDLTEKMEQDLQRT